MLVRRGLPCLVLSVGLLVTGVAGRLVIAVAADAQLPREVTLATNPPGTSYYAVASGLAKVVSGAARFQMVVQPYTGTSTMLPLLNTGEVDFGLVNAVDMGLSYRGPDFKIGGRNPFPHASNLRLVMRGSPLVVGLLVRKDSPIRSVHDVRGKRMTGEYPAHLAVWYNMFGHLSSAGLAWQDVRVVPVPAVNDGVDALVQGRADVTEHALGSAKVKEADSAVGVRPHAREVQPQMIPSHLLELVHGRHVSGSCHRYIPPVVVMLRWRTVQQL